MHGYGRDGLVVDVDGRALPHITDPIRHEVASRVGGLLWSPTATNWDYVRKNRRLNL